jgi:hypothetical protein
MNPRFTLLAAATSALLTAAVVPSLAQLYQTVVPSEPPGGAQGALSIPDFSGIWAHYSFPGFEPPISGPRSVMNKLHVANPREARTVGDYTNPILKPHAAEAVKKHGEMELRGVLAPNPRNQCWPRGGPFAFSNVGILMIQQPDRITILSADDHEVRRVRLNEPHPARVTPTWYGDSVGHYEGDTLVIDTVGVKVGPFAMVDGSGHRTPRLCMWSNVTGSSITKPRRPRKNAVKGKMSLFLRPTKASYATATTGARVCSSTSPSRMKASLRRHGRQRSAIGAR